MERILSKDEISELLAAVREGEIETEPEFDAIDEPEVETSRLDLVRAQSAGRGRFQNIDIVFDTFARNYGMSLTNRMQTSVSVKREEMETQEYESFLNKLPKNGLIGVARLDPLKAGGLMIFDAELSFSLLEMVLGGTSGGKFTIFERAMTAIEMSVVRGVIADVCPDLRKALAPLEKVDVSLIKVETNPRLVNIVTPDAPILVTRFTVAIDNFSGTMTLAIPHATLEPLREKLKESMLGGGGQRDGLWASRMHQELGETEMEVSACLGNINLLVRDILNFEVGDVIDLGCDPNTPLSVHVESKPKFYALPGLKNGKKAVRLTSRY